MNNSGINPLDQRVLVMPDKVEQRTAGGIIIPESALEQKEHAQIKATLVAVGVNAWWEAKAHPAFTAPVPGNRVMIAKYGGVLVTGSDGAEYRIMNDADITAVLEETA